MRDCVLTMPLMAPEDEARLIKTAQAGGLRIKSIIPEAVAVLLAFGVDDSTFSGTVLVVDAGWSRTEVSVYDVRAGVFHLRASKQITVFCGKVVVDLMCKHCVKDFTRRSKVPGLADNARGVLRLHKECEQALKILSVGAETAVNIDSLFEGADYSGKLSRARVDDLCMMPYMQFKQQLAEFLESEGLTAVSHVALAGGLAAVQKVQSTVAGVVPAAEVLRPSRGAGGGVMSSTAEAQCVGAALHARTICQQGRLDSGPTAMETRPALASALRVSAGGPETLLALPKGALLPCQAQAEALVSTDKAFLRLLEADSDEVLGELEVQAPAGALDGTQTVEVVLSVSLQGALDLTVRRKGSGEVWGKFEAA